MPNEPRTCKTCKTVLIQREHESFPRFSKKQFCSAKCAREMMRIEKRGWWHPQAMRQVPFNEGGE